MLGLTLHLRKVRRTGRVSIWLMAVNTRGERKERLARAAELNKKASAHFVFLHMSVIDVVVVSHGYGYVALKRGKLIYNIQELYLEEKL